MSHAGELIDKPLVNAWSAAFSRSPMNTVRPTGIAHTRAPGPWPLRVLFIGCGAAVGEGVSTHDLAIPGHVARMLAVETARGVDIDVVVDPEMTPSTALSTLSRIRVSHYDAIVVMLGAADAAQLTPIAAWGHDFRRLLAHIGDTASGNAETFVVSLSLLSKPPVARLLSRAVADRHARRLNAAMCAVTASMAAVTLVPLGNAGESGVTSRRSTEVFRGLSRQIATPMSRVLNLSPTSFVRRVDIVDEIARQHAVDQLSLLNEDAMERLDRITALAQKAFGVASAAITIIDNQWQIFLSRQNIDMTRSPRRDGLCTVTIAGREALVVNDASIDPRFAANPLVTGEPYIRFYAGYPIEAPNGERVGALCVMHDEPMEFTEENVIQLRTLALFAQDELWSEGYHYERKFGERTGDVNATELLKSGF